ncbi:hypothetical protein KUTeg_022817 [Tegillarca granosa]|uniref:Uncharacterized protein n=1 Tax=Tegillarca granosa TaxID=220873 RepID=A0ABQ9E4G0_TEGGR|nr:hypothetical protein KUTeg_022817 [Tegillarca granosa]
MGFKILKMSTEKGGYPPENTSSPPPYSQGQTQGYGAPPQNLQYGMGQTQYIQTAPVSIVFNLRSIILLKYKNNSLDFCLGNCNVF